MKKLFYFLLCLATPVFAQNWEGLALTRPMGWNSWNTFASMRSAWISGFIARTSLPAITSAK